METGSRADLGWMVERSASPGEVGATLDRLAEARPDLLDRIDGAASEALVAVLGASRSLSRLLEFHPEHLSVFGELDVRSPRQDHTIDELVTWERREFLRIAARDLAGLDPLETTGHLLAVLAADVLDAACLLADADDLTVIGMGKLGGDELNYASDVDVMFVGDGDPAHLERRARAVVELAGRCFRVDTNLRPQGRDGPLTRSLDSYEAYWDRWAEPWEFQALLKARPVAGEPKLGARFHDTAQRWLWSRPFGTEELRHLRAMKARAEAEVARKGLADREIKRGRGGIRDIEFTVQLLQLVHGHADPDLRSPTTLVVLDEMAAAGYIDPSDAVQLGTAYRYLRTVEHRLQLLDEQQTHTVPDEPAVLDRIARVMGERDTSEGSAVECFERELRGHQLAVRLIHERVYFRPLLEAFAVSEGGLDAEAAVERLQAFGFTDAKRTQAAVRELTRGLNRTSRLMQQMLPLLLDWLSRAPDPDLGLLMLRNLLRRGDGTNQILESFRESPEVAQRLCMILGTSRLVGDLLAKNPDLVVRLPFEDRLRTRPRDELVRSAETAVSWRREQRDRQEALRRWKERHLVGIAARDIEGYADTEQVGRDLTRLAEASLEVALGLLEPSVPFAVIAMGRFGGAELSYASDLDVIFVYDPGVADDGSPRSVAGTADEAKRLASGVLRFLGGGTPADRIYEIDADLRPEGKNGPLTRTVDGYRRYWETYALVWERQAMTRARPVAGDLALARRLLADLDEIVWGPGLDADQTREIRRMKARIENERIPHGEDPQFHLKLGRGSLSDVEFTVQLLQLRHGVRATGTIAALDALAGADLIDREDADILRESYRFCERVRNRLFLVNSAPSNALPPDVRSLQWLARSFDMTPSELRETYRRVTRRARRVVERVFYGQE